MITIGGVSVSHLLKQRDEERRKSRMSPDLGLDLGPGTAKWAESPLAFHCWALNSKREKLT